MADRFLRHPEARFCGPDGTEAGCGALIGALAAGSGFRIGLEEDPPPPQAGSRR